MLRSMFLSSLLLTTLAADPTWSTPQVLSAPGVARVNGALGFGRAVVAWLQKDDLGYSLQAAEMGLDGCWSEPEQITHLGRLAQKDLPLPQLSIDGAGSYRLVWAGHRGDYRAVYAAAKSPGESWSAPHCLSQSLHDMRWTAIVPFLAANASGKAVVLWTACNDLPMPDSRNLVQAVIQEGGSNAWGTPTTVSIQDWDFTKVGPPHRAIAKSVAINESGEVLAAWPSFSANLSSSPVFVSGNQGDVWAPPAEISCIPGWLWNTHVSGKRPEVSIGEGGHAAVTWSCREGYLWAALRDPSGVWALPEQLCRQSEGPGVELRQHVSVDPRGNVTAVWLHVGSGGRGFFQTNFYIQTRSRPVGGAWKPIHTLSDELLSERSPEFGINEVGPSMAMDHEGRVTVAWMDGSLTQVPHEAIFVASKDTEDQWSVPSRISSGEASASSPQLIGGVDEGVMLLWEEGPAEAKRVYVTLGER